MSSPWFSARAKPKPTARNIRVSVTIRVNTKLTAHMSNLKHTPVRKTAPINPRKLSQLHLHFLMILISEVKESGNVESQLWHVLEKEKHQTQTTHAAAETRHWDILSVNVNVPLRSSCICRCFMSWRLTLINRARRHAADTDRCTAADGKAPPEKQNTLQLFASFLAEQVHVWWGSAVGITNLAYFLEVELWQGMEPVGQLSEVEKLHLKPTVVVFGFFFKDRQVEFQEKEHSTSLYYITL